MTWRRRRPLIIAGSVTAVLLIPTAVFAAGRFTDDDDSIFEDNIEWLASAGVTVGCNPPDNTNFCPDDNVTRGQMAAFMQRFAQYLGAEDGTPAEADSVGGYGPAELQAIVTGTQFDWLDSGAINTGLTGVEVLSLPVEPAVDGYAAIDATLAKAAGADLDFTMIWLELDNGECSGNIGAAEPADYIVGSIVYNEIETQNIDASMATTVAVPLAAGQHTISLCAQSTVTAPVWSAGITAVFSPTGDSVATTGPSGATGARPEAGR